jgi:hypothetical protein
LKNTGTKIETKETFGKSFIKKSGTINAAMVFRAKKRYKKSWETPAGKTAFQ